MVINFQGIDKYESNHIGDGKMYGKTRTEVRTGKIYEFLQLTVMNPGVTVRWELLTWVSRNVIH